MQASEDEIATYWAWAKKLVKKLGFSRQLLVRSEFFLRFQFQDWEMFIPLPGIGDQYESSSKIRPGTVQVWRCTYNIPGVDRFVGRRDTETANFDLSDPEVANKIIRFFNAPLMMHTAKRRWYYDVPEGLTDRKKTVWWVDD